MSVKLYCTWEHISVFTKIYLTLKRCGAWHLDNNITYVLLDTLSFFFFPWGFLDNLLFFKVLEIPLCSAEWHFYSLGSSLSFEFINYQIFY